MPMLPQTRSLVNLRAGRSSALARVIPRTSPDPARLRSISRRENAGDMGQVLQKHERFETRIRRHREVSRHADPTRQSIAARFGSNDPPPGSRSGAGFRNYSGLARSPPHLAGRD